MGGFLRPALSPELERYLEELSPVRRRARFQGAPDPDPRPGRPRGAVYGL